MPTIRHYQGNETRPDPEFNFLVVKIGYMKGISLVLQGRYTEAYVALDEVIKRFGSDTEPDCEKSVTIALICKALIQPYTMEKAIDEQDLSLLLTCLA